MFLKRIELFSLLGFKVSLDLSWAFLAVLVTWTLASNYFPQTLPDQSSNTYLWMGIAGALGLFVSIILHEFAHAIVARRYDLKISGITLFIFGGVAKMTEEPKTPKAEFMMAIAGPLLSFGLAGVFHFVEAGLLSGTSASPVTSVFGYLAFLNLALAIFNLLPAFPLDGGRIFRSIVWFFTGSLARATRISSGLGRIFAGVFMALGLLSLISGNTISGIWMLLIGFFVYSAAGSSRMQLAAATLLKGVPLARVMRADPVTVSSEISLKQLVEDFFYIHHHRFFPVANDGVLRGCVDIKQARAVPRSKWSRTRVSDIMTNVTEANILDVSEDAYAALKKTLPKAAAHHMVLDSGRLVGIVTPKDILSYLAIHLELEADSIDEVSAARAKV